MQKNRTPLNGLTLIALRPAAELRGLRRCLQRAGGELFSAPVLQRALLRGADIESRLQQAASAELCLFTSRFAVRATAGQIALAGFHGIQLAVGAATAAALRAAGAARVRCPTEGADSEALLAMPELQGARQAWLLSGAGGRGLIDLELSQRGCTLHRIDLYERRARRLPAHRRRALLAIAPPRLLAISSLDALQAWLGDAELAAASRAWPVLAASPRIARALTEHGLRASIVAASAQADDLLEAALAYAKQAPFR